MAGEARESCRKKKSLRDDTQRCADAENATG